MKYKQGCYLITERVSLAKEIYSLTVKCPDVAEITRAGQFVHILIPGFMLRRPISICDFDQEKGTIRLVFEVRGEGTKQLTKLGEGDFVDLMAPLGNGFNLFPTDQEVIVVGGGIGVPPLLPIAKKYDHVTAILGFRTAAVAILAEDFKNYGADLRLCSDDGTLGQKGFVTQALTERLTEVKPRMILACGPTPMLKGVAAIAREQEIACFVSMEQRMGCGVGACLVCACKHKDGFRQVCKHGPIFKAEEVFFDD